MKNYIMYDQKEMVFMYVCHKKSLLYKAFNKVWHGGLLHKPKGYGASGQIFGLI